MKEIETAFTQAKGMVEVMEALKYDEMTSDDLSEIKETFYTLAVLSGTVSGKINSASKWTRKCIEAIDEIVNNNPMIPAEIVMVQGYLDGILQTLDERYNRINQRNSEAIKKAGEVDV